jgi:hypothetical protein
MKIPASELLGAGRKCTILAGLKEDYRHVIEALERHYEVVVSVQVVRPVVGGGAGPEQILLSEMDNKTSDFC